MIRFLNLQYATNQIYKVNNDYRIQCLVYQLCKELYSSENKSTSVFSQAIIMIYYCFDLPPGGSFQASDPLFTPQVSLVGAYARDGGLL